MIGFGGLMLAKGGRRHLGGQVSGLAASRGWAGNHTEAAEDVPLRDVRVGGDPGLVALRGEAERCVKREKACPWSSCLRWLGGQQRC